MSSVVFRGLRLAVGIVFVFGAAMVVAPAAHAQWTSSDTCVFPTDVPPLFFGSFNGYDNCESLCKQTANYCRKFAKNGANCWQNNLNGVYGIYKKSECASLPSGAERQDCKQMTNQNVSSLKDEVKSSLKDALDACDAYRDSCIMNCMPL